jgi:hypothetical protein
MTARLFEWRDLPTLYRFRPQSLFLDTMLVLTRGPMLISGALLSTIAPNLGITTFVYSGKAKSSQPVFGQVIHTRGSPLAHLTFLTPNSALASPDMINLLDSLTAFSGGNGAYHLLAEVDEAAHVFTPIHQAGFAIYTRQQIWQFRQPVKNTLPFAWREAATKDLSAIRTLYNNLVPGLVQQVEPFPLSDKPGGLVYMKNGDLVAYVELIYGARGIWVQPFVHPNAENVTEHILALIGQLPERRGRPIYMCVRSYQSWLEVALQELEAEPGPRQAVMVKHLAVLQKPARLVTTPALESGQPEISAPYARSTTEK